MPVDRSPACKAQFNSKGRWTIKRGCKRERPAGDEGARRQAQQPIAVPVFGEKNPIGIDRHHGFVRRSTITHAARHDGARLGALLDLRGLVAPFRRGRFRS